MSKLTKTDLEELAATTRLARRIAATIPPEELPVPGLWYSVDAKLLPDPDGDIELDGVRYRQKGKARVTVPASRE